MKQGTGICWKYNAPDYELLLGQGCKFAIENSMILHNSGS